MAYRRQSSNEPKAMASLAQARVKEGHPCYLVYDTSDKSYYACSAPEKGWTYSEKPIKRFLPDGTSNVNIRSNYEKNTKKNKKILGGSF